MWSIVIACLRNPFIRVGVDIDTFNTKYMIWLNGAPDSWFKALPHFKQQLGCSLLWDSVLIGWELCPAADQLPKTGFEAFSALYDGRMALQMIGEFLPLSLPGSSTKPTLTGNLVIKDPSLNKSVSEDISEYCVVYRCKIEELYHLSKLQLTLRHNWLLKHKYTWRLSASEIATVTWEIFQPTSRHILNC